MSLCIALYTHQVPADFGEILMQAEIQAKSKATAALKEITEAEPHD